MEDSRPLHSLRNWYNWGSLPLCVLAFEWPELAINRLQQILWRDTEIAPYTILPCFDNTWRDFFFFGKRIFWHDNKFITIMLKIIIAKLLQPFGERLRGKLGVGVLGPVVFTFWQLSQTCFSHFHLSTSPSDLSLLSFKITYYRSQLSQLDVF